MLGGSHGELDFEAEARHMLLTRMVAARKDGDQRRADEVLVEATRWLTTHPYDAVIVEARNQIRIKFPPSHYFWWPVVSPRAT
jgi:hypothetical protein